MSRLSSSEESPGGGDVLRGEREDEATACASEERDVVELDMEQVSNHEDITN